MFNPQSQMARTSVGPEKVLTCYGLRTTSTSRAASASASSKK